MAAGSRPAVSADARPTAAAASDGHPPREPDGPAFPVAEDEVRALIALAALGGPDRLSHHERLALGRALEASPALRAELRALAAVAAALPPPAPTPTTALGRIGAALPPALLRVQVVAALAAAILLLGVVRVASGTGTAEATVTTATVSTVDATAAVVARAWGVEVRLDLAGTSAGEGYEVVVADHDGGTVAVGSFTGEDGPVRFVGTAGVPRDEVAELRVTDASGDLILRADLG
ncbi:MAG: hypothetical protein KY457_10945 [Actinobacteria bacterium]|nr:hypothetical protein [Actinomycetota bacterium]